MVKKKTRKSVRSSSGNQNYAKLHAVKFALSLSILSAAFIFIMTLFGINGIGSVYLASIESIYGYFGYSVSIAGAFIGAVYVFVDTFIATWIFVWLYNKML